MSIYTYVWQFWHTGFDSMPPMIKTIYNHNLEICKKYNIHLILITDENVSDYITVHKRYYSLAYNHKSDYVRFQILHKFGGFWFDCDVIIIKDLTKIYYDMLMQFDYDCILDRETRPGRRSDGSIRDQRIGCASIVMKPNSRASSYCIQYNDDRLNKNGNFGWRAMGPALVDSLYINMPEIVKLNECNITLNGCNYITWNSWPNRNTNKWLLNDENTAEEKALMIKNNENCHYIITWTIYKSNLFENLTETVFKDKHSIFSYFIDNKHIENNQ